jgi:hypothetical protein
LPRRTQASHGDVEHLLGRLPLERGLERRSLRRPSHEVEEGDGAGGRSGGAERLELVLARRCLESIDDGDSIFCDLSHEVSERDVEGIVLL